MSGVFHKLLLVRSIRFRKARALLFFLLHSPEQDHRSEKIADVFWGDYPHDKAMASLRQTIRQVRLLLSEAEGLALETRRGHLQLQCEDTTPIDAKICAVLSSPPWPEDTEQDLGYYLQEFELLLGLSEAFDSWLSIRKAQATQAIAEVLEAQYTDPKNEPEAVQAAKLAQVVEMSNEVAARFLMRHFWANQQPNRAIETYNTLFEHLDQYLDQEPEPKTIDLLASIKLGEALPAKTPKMDAPPKILVRIQNETNLTPEERSLLNVLFIDLRMRLSRFREWGIAESDSLDAVDLVVKIQLLPQMPDAPLHIEISNPESNNLLWAEMIPAPQNNWDEKVRTQLGNIANALSLGAGGNNAPTQEARIYDRWLRSQVLIDRWSPDTEGEAIQMMSDITIDAPRFGPAHAELAGALNVRHILLPGTKQTEAEKQRALHHALEAISLDPLDTRAHRVLAWCYCHKAEFELAEFHFEQAMHLNSSNSLTLASCALGFAFAGRLEVAQEICARMLCAPGAMQPFHLIYMAAVNYLSGDFERARAQCAQAGDAVTTSSGGWHAAALYQLGRKEEAHSCIENYVDSVKKQWSLPREPTASEVLDWYTACFPLREESARKALRETVGHALDFGR